MSKSNAAPTNSKLAEQILFDLTVQHPDQEIAVLIFKDRTFFSTFKKGIRGPSSAVVKLIQGIFDQYRDLSFFILRQRIFATEAISPMIQGMVRLTAKRISRTQALNHSLHPAVRLIRVGSDEPIFPVTAFLDDPIFEVPRLIGNVTEGIGVALQLARAVPRGEVLHEYNRSVAAILVSESGDVLSWSTNQASMNKTLHAEVRTVQKFWDSTHTLVPPGAHLFVTLKPCQMCAGMIAESCEDLSSLKVYFAENDKGPLAQRTALEKNLIYLESND